MNKSSSIIILGGAQTSASSIMETLQFLDDYNGEVVIILSQANENLKDQFPNLDVRIIPKWNAAAAANQVLLDARSDVLHFIGAGAVITSLGLNELQNEVCSHPSIGAVAPLGNTSGWQSASYFLGPQSDCSIDKVEDVLEVQRRFSVRYSAQSRKVKSVEFCGMTLRREMFQALGGFDEDLNEVHTPLDLAWRIQLMGKELRVVQSAFIFFPPWKNPVEQMLSPEHLEQKNMSEWNLSHKLIRHYGTVSQVPSSWELWEIEHFQLKEASEMESSSPNHDLSSSRPAVVLYATSATTQLDQAYSLSIAALLKLGFDEDQILLVNGSDEAPMIQQNVVVWSLSDLMDWSTLLLRLQGWFHEKNLLILELGWMPTQSSWREIITHSDVEKFEILSGNHDALPTLNVFDGTHSLLRTPIPCVYISHDFNLPSQSEIPVSQSLWMNFTKLDLLDPLQDQTTKSPSQNLPQEPLLESSVDEKLQPENPVSEGVPLAPSMGDLNVDEWISQATFPGFWGKDIYVDKENQPIAQIKPDRIIVDLDAVDMPALSVVLRLLQHPGLEEVLFRFSNSYFQNTSPKSYSHCGISPYDLRREVELAGLGNLKWYVDPQGDLQSDQISYNEMEIDTKLRSEFEILCNTSSQMFLTAQPVSKKYHHELKVSIVVLALNKMEYTAKCIESTIKHCRQNYEWILVNNGSTDGTQEYFEKVPQAQVIHNSENLGVSAGWNQGIQAASGDYILILNNDVILAPGSIENLVRCAVNHPRSGIIAPRTNNIAGPQKIDGFAYRNDDAVPGQLIEIMEQNQLSSWQYPMIKGFCMLLPREVIEKVGFFDEQFGFGNFEDDDYSQRVARAGYELRVANDSVIFHFGSMSFGQANIDWDQQMVKNQELYNQKWKHGRSSIIEFQSDFVVPPDVMRDGKDHEPSQRPQEVSAEQLESQKESLITNLSGDQGDGQLYRKIARIEEELNQPDQAFQFYCKSIEIDPHQHQIDHEVMSFLKKNYTHSQRGSVIQFLANKFMHLSAFQIETEEQIEVDDSWAERVQQFIESGNYREAESVLVLAESQGKKNPAWYNYRGLLYWYDDILDQAYQAFKKGLEFDPINEDMLLNLNDCAIKLRLFSETQQILERALSLDSQMHEARKCLEVLNHSIQRNQLDPELMIRRRELNLQLENKIREGLIDTAFEEAETLISQDSEDYRAWNNLGLIYWYKNDMVEAIQCFVKSIKLNSWYTDAILNYYDCALLTGQIETFEPVLNQCILLAPGNEELIQVRKEMILGQWPERLSNYQNVQSEVSHEKEKLKEANELIQRQEYDQAVLILTDLMQSGKELAEAYNSLAIISFYWGNHADAWSLVRKSLSLSPLNVDALLNLWDIALQTQQEEEAREILLSALEMDPTLLEIDKIVKGGLL